MVDQAKTRMTAAEFFQLPESLLPRQLLNGEVVEMLTPIPEHQAIVGNAYLLLRQLRIGKAYMAPLEVYLDDANVPQPDVMWIAPESRCVVGPKRLEGPPDLVVEVLSPSTAQIDQVDKFALYQRHGVCEYRIADPVYRLLEAWQWVEGRFVQQGIFAPGATFVSAAPNGAVIDVRRSSHHSSPVLYARGSISGL